MASILLTIGEPILSDVISRLIDKATTSDFLYFVRKENLEVEIKKWHKTLTKLNAVLADAEKKKKTSEASDSVKEWLTDLKTIVYDVEDVFDELNYEALRHKFTAESQATICSSKMRALIPSCCSSFSLSNVKFGSKLKDITTRLAEIVKQKNDLGLTEVSYDVLEKRKPTSSFVDQSRVAGCKILVTTRNKFVMTTMNVTPHNLERLSVEDCKLILQDYALGGTGNEGKNQKTHFLSYDVLHRMLPEFKFLRVLSLYSYAISEVPKNIGDLKLLRHLNLSWSYITTLPDTVATLYNLETLILYQCSYLDELPADIKNLIKLHELDLSYTRSLQEMPSGISSLTKLHKLSKFIVSKGDKHQIRELQGLTRLRGKLSIYGLENVQDVHDVRIANLKGKERLDNIALIWSNDFYERDEVLEMQVLDWLEPNINLKVLEIESYGGNDFPSWLGNPYFVNMERITLLGCEKSKWLPSLGRLPLLNYLRIEGSNGVESVGREFSSSNSFPKLDTLEFENMLNWVDWRFAMLKNVQSWRSSPRHAIILKTSLKDGVMKKSFKYEYVHLMLFEIRFW
ncbi:hypothetical protein ACFE04_009692 [Oxalis oulophora]